MKNKLAIAYWYKEDGDKDACVFVYDNESKKGLEEQFIAYAKMQEWGKIKEEDIEGVYGIDEEEDYKGNVYKVIIQ